MLRLLVKEKGKAERVFVSRGDRVTLGRAPGNDLILQNPHVSSRHALIELHKDSILFRDAGSTNGSMIKRGSEQIDVEAGGEAVISYAGDTFVLGDSEEPVLLQLLDNDSDADRHPFDSPPDTAVSQLPVDPAIAGHVLMRRAAKDFHRVDERFFAIPGLAQLLFARILDLGQGDESEIIEDVVQSILQFCPGLSHVLVQLSAGAEKRSEFRKHFVRGQKNPDSLWSAGRGGLYVRTVIAREAWLVERPVIETDVDDSMRLPMAICVPLLRSQQSLGYLFADNRASGTDLDSQSLAILAALTQSLAAMLDAHRALQKDVRRSKS